MSYTFFMKAFSSYQKTISIIVGFFTMISLSSCNMMGFMDKPSGDVQLLDAARACLDKGDFTCARDYYQALSNSYLDVKVSETSLTTLEENNIFFMADLFESLGSGTGGASSVIALAETLAARGITTATNRTTIQSTFQNDLAISDSTLKAYSQFISSVAMLSTLLASSVGADGKLTASDLATNATVCKTKDVSSCAAASECDNGGGMLDAAASEITEASGIGVATNWDTAVSAVKFRAAANDANNASTTLTGSNGGGIFGAIKGLGNAPAGNDQANARCTRMFILQSFFP